MKASEKKMTQIDKPPTKEQIKEVAKWCGFTDIRVYVDRLRWDGTAPNGEFRVVYINLTNQVEYAVPKVLDKLATQGFVPPLMKLFQLWYDRIVRMNGDSRNLANWNVALFWAIYEVIKAHWEAIHADKQATHRGTTERKDS